MRHALHSTLDHLLAPETLTNLSGVPVASVTVAPLVAGHSASGSKLSLVTANDGHGPTFVLKQISLAWDWIMRATLDHQGREVVIWRTGFLDDLPPEITHAVLACATDGAGWALLMRDMTAAVYPPRNTKLGFPITDEENQALLGALAALHAQHWNRPQALDPTLGFCRPGPRFSALSAGVAAREHATDAPYLECMRQGWADLPRLIDPSLAQTIRALSNDPQPLAAAHRHFPMTAIHGDPRPPNVGFVRRANGTLRVLLYDWQFAGPGWATTDLAWYLYCASACDAIQIDPAITLYRAALAERLGARFDPAWWEPLLALGLLGQFVRCAHDVAWCANHGPMEARGWARRSLDWWSARAIEGLRVLNALA
ncbi:MAG: phosphotransferase [Thermomicrobiales bacterium]|nr:phosphotransferase [Thermomicrobiales bacterium]